MDNEPDEEVVEEVVDTLQPTDEELFPVVGIGASAGGLETFERLFTNMPPDSGMAFVIVQHLDPTHESILANLLTHYTKMPVEQVDDGVKVKPNHVYVIPPNRDLDLQNGNLRLTKPAEPRGFRLPIDHFFRSLAHDQRERAISIVLSGNGSDGSLGIGAVKEAGGMTIVQSPETATYTGMPESAIATGLADLILPPEEMPQALLRYKEISVVPLPSTAQPDDEVAQVLRPIYGLLRNRTSHDFSNYKLSTIRRRIERRMVVNKMESLDQYLAYLQHSPHEVDALFKELLIGVTSFFRDTEAFKALRNRVLPALFKNRPSKSSIRVWVTGCSTGEEAYSIAILLHDFMVKNSIQADCLIFATDVDADAIEKARLGIYPDNITADVPVEFLQRYFVREGGNYHVNKRIRSMVVFAQQSIIKDPPFSRIDLISCRNVLIYLNTTLQNNIIPLFHYALNPDGFLFLGTSETLTRFDHLFKPVDRKWKLFQKQNVESRPRSPFVYAGPSRLESIDQQLPDTAPQHKISDLAHGTLLGIYSPPAVVVNNRGDILYFHKDTSDFIRPASGEATLNISRMARQELRMPLVSALRKVAAHPKTISIPNFQLLSNEQNIQVNIEVRPIESAQSIQGLILITFEEVESKAANEELDPDADNDGRMHRILQLEQELGTTREYLQTTVEELETSNEELKSTNEELQSANEELQSTNEELETAKEELQSVNEELMTVNSELNSKIEELANLNADQMNMLQRINIGLIFLNPRLQVRLFNSVASDLLNLISTDIGRPIAHLAANLEYDHIVRDCEYVLNTLDSVSEDIRSTSGQWFSMEIHPYRNTDGDMEGLIVTFANVTSQRALMAEIAEREAIYLTLARNLPDAAVLLFDHDQRIMAIEGQALNQLGVTGNELRGKKLQNVVSSSERLERLQQIFRNTLEGEVVFEEELINNAYFELRAAPVSDSDGDVEYGILVAWDITEKKMMTLELERNEAIFRTMATSLPNMAVFVFDNELRYLFAGGESLIEAGFKPDAVIGRSLHDVLPAESAKEIEQYYRAALKGERIKYVRTYNGKRYRVTSFPVHTDQGDILGGMLLSEELPGDSAD